jgi:hypothetical protein
MVENIVIKLGPARRVNAVAGPVRVRQKTKVRKNSEKPGRLVGLTSDAGDPAKPG